MQISSRSLVESLLGVLAVWLVVSHVPDYTASLFASRTSLIEPHRQFNVAALQAVHLGASLACGLLLLFVRRPLARWLTPDAVETTTTTPALLAVGAACVGLYITASGFSSFAMYLINYREIQGIDPYLKWSGLSSIFVGALTIFCAPWVARLLQIRHRKDAA